MWHDLRYSVHTLLKQPLFCAVAVAVLALGIGLNTAVFSVVSALLFRPLPVHAPEQLAYIYWTLPKQPDRPAVLWHGPFEYLREHNQTFAGLSGTWGRPFRLTVDGDTEMLHGEQVQVGYFEVLGVDARLGRTLAPADSDPSTTELAIVISHDLWERRFDADPGVLAGRFVLRHSPRITSRSSGWRRHASKGFLTRGRPATSGSPRLLRTATLLAVAPGFEARS